MIMPCGFHIRGDYPQGTRHAQMHQQSAGIGIEKQILPTALDAAHNTPNQALTQIIRDRPTQAALSYFEIDDRLTVAVWLHAPAGGLDFGQFRHEICAGNDWRLKKTPVLAGVEDAVSCLDSGGYLIFPSLYITCLRTTGSNFFISSLSGVVRLFLSVV
jgi:hypothetical protein